MNPEPGTSPLARRALLRRALALGVAASGGLAVLAACGGATAVATARPVAPATPTTGAGAATPATPAPVASPATPGTPPRPGPVTPAGTASPVAGRGGVSDRAFALGTWGPQDGPAGSYGVISRVIAAYFARVNIEGGIAGRTVAVLNENDGYQPQRTATVMKKLVEEDRVLALVGGFGNANNLQVLDYLTQMGVPHLAPAAGLGALARPTRPTVFCVQPSYADEATLLIRHALDTLGARRPTVFFQDDAAGREGRDAIQVELRRRGLAAASEATYAPTDRNAAAQALRLQAGNADAVLIYAMTQAGGGLIRELARIGATPRLLASSLIDDQTIFDLAGPTSDGLIVPSWLPDLADTADPQVAGFRAWLAANLPNEQPTAFAAAGYAFAALAAELLRRVGRDLTRDRLVEVANGLRGYSGGLIPSLSYTPDDHRGIRALALHQARYAERRFARLTEPIELR